MRSRFDSGRNLDTRLPPVDLSIPQPRCVAQRRASPGRAMITQPHDVIARLAEQRQRRRLWLGTDMIAAPREH
jgi:hypothetical protein